VTEAAELHVEETDIEAGIVGDQPGAVDKGQELF